MLRAHKILPRESSLLLALFLLTTFAYPQILNRGFGQTAFTPVLSNASALFVFEGNSDLLEDILISSPRSGKVQLRRAQKESFETLREFPLPYSISAIAPVFRKDSTEYFLTLSRAGKRIAYSTFTKTGQVKNEFFHVFKDAPSSFSAADINGDKTKDALLSGAGFQGLTIFSVQDGKFIEYPIEQRRSFSFSFFVSVNMDNLIDIAAYYDASGEIWLYHNSGQVTFRKARALYVGKPLTAFFPFDVNKDGIQDLICVTKNEVIVYFGDFTGAFEKNLTIPLQENPAKVVFGDFNGDGLTDLIYFSGGTKRVQVLFQNGAMLFPDEYTLYTHKNISDIAAITIKNNKALAVLLTSGELLTIDRSVSETNEALFCYGGNGTFAESEILPREMRSRVLSIDTVGAKATLIENSQTVFGETIFSFPLLLPCEAAVTADFLPRRTLFCFFSPGKTVIEAVQLDRNGYKTKRDFIYTEGKILDVRGYLATGNNPAAAVLQSSAGMLIYSEFVYKNGLWKEYSFAPAKGKVRAAHFDAEGNLFFWMQNEESIRLFCTKPYPKAKVLLLISLSNKEPNDFYMTGLRDEDGNKVITVLAAHGSAVKADTSKAVLYSMGKGGFVSAPLLSRAFSKGLTEEAEVLNYYSAEKEAVYKLLFDTKKSQVRFSWIMNLKNCRARTSPFPVLRKTWIAAVDSKRNLLSFRVL